MKSTPPTINQFLAVMQLKIIRAYPNTPTGVIVTLNRVSQWTADQNQIIFAGTHDCHNGNPSVDYDQRTNSTELCAWRGTGKRLILNEFSPSTVRIGQRGSVSRGADFDLEFHHYDIWFDDDFFEDDSSISSRRFSRKLAENIVSIIEHLTGQSYDDLRMSYPAESNGVHVEQYPAIIHELTDFEKETLASKLAGKLSDAPDDQDKLELVSDALASILASRPESARLTVEQFFSSRFTWERIC